MIFQAQLFASNNKALKGVLKNAEKAFDSEKKRIEKDGFEKIQKALYEAKIFSCMLSEDMMEKGFSAYVCDKVREEILSELNIIIFRVHKEKYC